MPKVEAPSKGRLSGEPAFGRRARLRPGRNGQRTFSYAGLDTTERVPPKIPDNPDS
jgi:hypothetical protein